MTGMTKRNKYWISGSADGRGYVVRDGDGNAVSPLTLNYLEAEDWLNAIVLGKNILEHIVGSKKKEAQ